MFPGSVRALLHLTTSDGSRKTCYHESIILSVVPLASCSSQGGPERVIDALAQAEEHVPPSVRGRCQLAQRLYAVCLCVLAVS